MFMTNFLASIILWRKAGERVIIFINMNKHILHGPLAKCMIRLGLTEATHKSWGHSKPHTHISGLIPIDGDYHSMDIKITSMAQLSFHKSVGDHCSVIVDISARSLLGIDGQKIIRPVARRLTCSNKKNVERFNKYVEKALDCHKLYEKLGIASQMLNHNPWDQNGIRLMENIDQQMAEIF